MFICRSDKFEYVKLIKDVNIDVLRKKDPFPKNMGDVCQVLSGWKNQYGKNTAGGESKKNCPHYRSQ